MRAAQVQAAIAARWRHPGYWVMGLSLQLLPLMLALVLPRDPNKRSGLCALVLCILGFLPALIGSPAPWQWSGDDRAQVGWGRGSLQCLVYVLLWAFLLALLLLVTGWMGPRTGSFLLGACVGLSIQLLLVLTPAGIVIARMEHLKQETQEAQARARDVKWMSHRGSFSPGLLFNNLKHLADLADRDAQATEQGLVALAELYRKGLIEAEHPLISLASERELAEQYLALERGRWGNALVVRWHLDPDLEHRLLPPLLLLPLLESLLAPGPEGGGLSLDVFAKADAGYLILRCLRALAGPAPAASALEAMLQRMRGLSGEGGSAELSPQGEGWELLLRIPSPGGES